MDPTGSQHNDRWLTRLSGFVSGIMVAAAIAGIVVGTLQVLQVIGETSNPEIQQVPNVALQVNQSPIEQNQRTRIIAIVGNMVPPYLFTWSASTGSFYDEKGRPLAGGPQERGEVWWEAPPIYVSAKIDVVVTDSEIRESNTFVLIQVRPSRAP